MKIQKFKTIRILITALMFLTGTLVITSGAQAADSRYYVSMEAPAQTQYGTDNAVISWKLFQYNRNGRIQHLPGRRLREHKTLRKNPEHFLQNHRAGGRKEILCKSRALRRRRVHWQRQEPDHRDDAGAGEKFPAGTLVVFHQYA